MKVLFAPDWRAGVPYQSLLATALAAQGVAVDFLTRYPRRLPLTRGVTRGFEVLHLHWPEAYFPEFHERRDVVRKLRYALDLRLATRHTPLLLTAHNLFPHNRAHDPIVRWNTRYTVRSAAAVIAHSGGARDALAHQFQIATERITIIPHGDLSAALGAPRSTAEARQTLGLDDRKICLMFGTLEPYKGLEEIIAAWKEKPAPAQLVIVGRSRDHAYETALRNRIGGDSRIDFRPRWLDDAQLRDWLSAADCVLFNYRAILTSGAASLARSYGLPVVLPTRLVTLDLDEPSPRVFRFGPGEMAAQIARALALQPDFASAADWRASIAWPEIAAQTAALYQRLATNHSRGRTSLH